MPVPMIVCPGKNRRRQKGTDDPERWASRVWDTAEERKVECFAVRAPEKKAAVCKILFFLWIKEHLRRLHQKFLLVFCASLLLSVVLV